MYTRRFFQTKLGQAAVASTIAMVAFIAMSAQIDGAPDFTAPDLKLAPVVMAIVGSLELA